MTTSRYTFAELLLIFFELQRRDEITQKEFARRIGVSLSTLTNWFRGHYRPRKPAQVERIAYELILTALQTDLLLYAVNPAWVKYRTPAHVLESVEIVRYRADKLLQSEPQTPSPPTIETIEQTWEIQFQELFVSNANHWGTGIKDDGLCSITREIVDGRYILSLRNRFHDSVFMGGDSSCFAPPVYYLTAEARIVEGDREDDGYGLIFEEISDNSFMLLRIRNQLRIASVISLRDGGPYWGIHVDRTPCGNIQPDGKNKLAILAIHDQHWFFVNDMLVGQANLPRIPHTRLDVGIISEEMHRVICEFTNFTVRVPPATELQTSTI